MDFLTFALVVIGAGAVSVSLVRLFAWMEKLQ